MKKPGRPKKQPKTYIGKNQLRELLAKPHLTIEDIARKLRAAPETVRKYIERYGL